MIFYEGKKLHNKQKIYLSGKNEIIVRSIIESLGFIEDKDFIWQYSADGYILDFAFPEYYVCVEADGKDHKRKEKRKSDFKRDNILYERGWVVIRINTENLDSFNLSFYRSLIREIIKERTPKTAHDLETRSI